MAEKTCCSRIRRAMSCVYCPPKSSTTIPPSSVLGMVLSLGAGDVDALAAVAPAAIAPPLCEVLPLFDDKVHQLIGNHNSLDHFFSIQQLRHFGLGNGKSHESFVR